MSIPEWVTRSYISDLRMETLKLRQKVEEIETGLNNNFGCAKDAKIMAMQAFLMGFYQVAIASSNVRELKEDYLRTLKEQGLSQDTLKEIDHWTTQTCEIVEKQMSNDPYSLYNQKTDQQISQPQQLPR